MYAIFTEKHDWLVRVIQLDEDWSQAWVNDNLLLEGYQPG